MPLDQSSTKKPSNYVPQVPFALAPESYEPTGFLFTGRFGPNDWAFMELGKALEEGKTIPSKFYKEFIM